MTELEPKSDYWMIRAAVIRASQEKDDETLEFLTLEYPDIVHQMEREILNRTKKK